MTTKLDWLRIDIGNRCTHCGVDTSFGAGNGMFVNRIPSTADAKLELQNSDRATVAVEGYMCPDCQAVECDECGEKTIEYHIVNRQDGTGIMCCVDCWADFSVELLDKKLQRLQEGR